MFRKLIACGLFCFAATIGNAQTLKTPLPSPTQTIKQDFGVGSIELSYSRPGMKGRKIFGDLVPFGKVWRTGANSATTLTFSDTVSIGGTKVAPGKYGLVTIPDKDQWTVIVTKQLDATSPASYKQDQDVVRVNVKPASTKDSYESFTMQFANVKSKSTDLQMMWENTMVAVPISTEFDSRIMADIEKAMRDSRPYFAAGMYYLDNGKDLNQALTWFDKAIEQNPKAYWVYHQKANALAKQGKKQEAKEAAQKSMELAKTDSNDDYVKLNEKLLQSLK
jgi:hypothetical protein